MKRYIWGGGIADEITDYDVVIIGSGIAGLYAALHVDPELKTAVITKAEFERSNSWLAQGGIASVISPDDFAESHIEDTLRAGAGLCDRRAVELLVDEGPRDIKELIELDVPFDRNPEGDIMLTREGGHSRRRIVHCQGDATGRETTRRLGQIVLERKHIDVLFRTYLIDIITDGSGVCGVLVFDGKAKIIRTSNVIIATGGIGHLYLSTTNPAGAIGDGIAAAHRAGADIFGMELVQFHPTTLFAGRDIERAFLISEAVRGEGGILKNGRGEAFMKDVHPLKDLAPRDIVTRAIIDEMNRTGEDRVYLDVSSMTTEFFSHRFPTIFDECRRRGVEIPEEPIPVRPAQHYQMGGIKTDLFGMSSVDGLYACGEASSTGVHGANRLASNSMLECLVFGRRAAEHISHGFREKRDVPSASSLIGGGERKFSRSDVSTRIGALRSIVSKYAGPVRTESGMNKGARLIGELYDEAESAVMTEQYELEYLNMASVAKMVIDGAVARKESIGAHYIAKE